MAETITKEYPYKEDDISYEKEITDAIKKLPLEQRILAVALNHYTLAKKKLDDKFDGEIDKIVQKYNALQGPLADRANEIISGEKAATKEEVQESIQYLEENEQSNVDNLLTAGAIEDYWFKVLTACERLSQDIFEVDHPLLKKITKIVHTPDNDTENFELSFHFAPNDYFENDVLKVKFFMLDDGQEPEKTEGTEIKWKEGKDITKKKVSKKQKNKKTGKTRTIEKIVEAESFFNFFKTISGPSGAEGDDEDGGEGEEELERLNINSDIANTLQEEIIPYHLEYYLGLRKGDYDNLGGLDDDENDDDDDDDDEDEKPKRKDSGKGKGKSTGGLPVAGGKPGEKPECKQQ